MPIAGDSSNEALKGLLCGVVFGITSPLVGHPFDSLKTRMQVQTHLQRGSSLRVLVNIVQTDGILRGLYRGLLPPLVGSAIYRSVQFSSYGAAYAAIGAAGSSASGSGPHADFTGQPKAATESWWSRPQDALGGMQPRVIAAALFSCTCRSLIETPLELLKVRRQCGLPWLPTLPSPTLHHKGTGVPGATATIHMLYHGVGITWIRTVFALGGFFVLMDHTERHPLALPSVHVDALPASLQELNGKVTTALSTPFVRGSLCATAAWWIAWPLEVLKSQVQASTDAVSPLTRAVAAFRDRGLSGTYRGIGPGTVRSLLANGAAVAAFTACQTRLDI